MKRIAHSLAVLAAFTWIVASPVPPAHATALLKPSGGVSQALTPKDLDIRSKIQGAFARTTITTVYANPNTERIEADFMYSAPEGSVVTGFAYWYNGEKVTARVVEKARAARIYQYITSRMRDPALIEMVGKNTFRARIFPVEANTDLKIEIQLAQVLKSTPKGYIWSHPLKDETARGALPNFHLVIQSDSAAESNLGKFQNGSLDVRRTNFLATENASILFAKSGGGLRANLFAARDGGQDGFFSLLLAPSSAISQPKVRIVGVKTYDVVTPTLARLNAGGNLLVVGRYRGAGDATVDLNGSRVQVHFVSAVQPHNVASYLWAANIIEQLSPKSSNRDRVMKLSTRFGVPSKWTSWLAIPEEERRNFLRQTKAADRSAAAKAYAQAIARGDRKTARQQKRIADSLASELRAMGENYAQEEELQPLKNYLNQELKSVQLAQVQAKYGGVSASRARQWRKWIANLKRAGARSGADGVEMPVYLLEDELRIASREYLVELEKGQEQGKRGRMLSNRLIQLAATRVAQEYGWSKDTFMSEQADMRANSLALELESDKASANPNVSKQKDLQTRLARVSTRSGRSAEDFQTIARTTIWSGKLGRIAESLGARIAAGQEDTPEAKRLSQELAALQEKSGLATPDAVRTAWTGRAQNSAAKYVASVRANGEEAPESQRLFTELQKESKAADGSPEDYVYYTLLPEYGQLTEAFAREVAAERENGARGVEITTKMNELKALAPKLAQVPEWTAGQERLQMAYRGRAHASAYKVAEAEKRGDATQANIHRSEVRRFAKNFPGNAESIESYERDRFANGDPAVDVKEYSSRPGDPLISVQAPRDSSQVIAILPSGEIKRLVWNAVANRWQARFDIPGYAEEGSYTIRILVAGKDGKRRQLTMTFHVDTTAPTGAGEVRAQGGEWLLSMEPGPGVDHIDAFLPWGERMELKAAGSVFSARARVPEAWLHRASQVRYVLTDAAHNRTEVLVDMSR